MSPHVRSWVVWVPRVMGIAAALFLVLFALDAFDGRSIAQVLPDFARHLIPAALVAAAVGLGWRFPWAGAAGFAALAIGYAVMVPQRIDWILAISGPLALTALLFALGGLSRRTGRSQIRQGS